MTRLPKKRGITQVEEDKSLILRTTGKLRSLFLEDSHSGRVRASRTRVDESLEGSNPSSSARSWARPSALTIFNLELLTYNLELLHIHS